MRRCRKRAHAHQFVVRSKKRALIWPLLRSGDELPPAFSQESMVAAGDELRSILEGDLVGWLARFPLGKHLCLHKMPKGALPHRTVDRIARLYSRNRFVSAFRHEDSCLRRYPEGTLVVT